MAPYQRHGWSLVLALLVTFCYSVCSITVSGPENALREDFEKFTCETEGEHELEWKYRYKNGDIINVTSSDMLTALEIHEQDFQRGKLVLTSFIRMKSIEIEEIRCYQSSNEYASARIQMQELEAISTLATDMDLCDKAKSLGKPLNVVHLSSRDFLAPYRRTHYIDGQKLTMQYPTDVAQVKLTCIAPSTGDTPKWSMKQGTLEKIEFASWVEKASDCKKQVLTIYDVKGVPGETVDFSLVCKAGFTSSSPLQLSFKIDLPPVRFDMNTTQACIENVVEQFYNKELTGVGIGSSFVMILMMAGMAIMKKQLNEQKNINKELQSKTTPNNEGSSTEQLNPHAQGSVNP